MKRLSKNTFKKYDALLITNKINCQYITNSLCDGKVLLTPSKNYFFTPPLFYKQAVAQVCGFEIVEIKKRGWLRNAINKLHIKKLGFESTISFAEYEKLKKIKIKLIPADGIIEILRQTKTKDEIEKIKKAQRITDKTFAKIIKYIRPGVTEKQIEWFIEKTMRKLGADDTAWRHPSPAIVAAGENSSFPHHIPTNKKLKEGDCIILDFGSKVDNYLSDMTRTVFLGEPSEEQKKIYALVLTAQELGLKKIKNGLLGKDVDKVSRDFLKKARFLKEFNHALGHSVGLEIHEEPVLSPAEKQKLKENMVITVEPGIYLPNKFGIRIEDMVVVTKKGCKNLTKSPKSLDKMIIPVKK